jgi:hypothetical protein
MGFFSEKGSRQDQEIRQLENRVKVLENALVNIVSGSDPKNILKQNPDGTFYVSTDDCAITTGEGFIGNGSATEPLKLKISSSAHNGLKILSDGSLFSNTISSNLLIVDNNYVSKNLDIVGVKTCGARMNYNEYHCTIALPQALLEGETVIIFDACNNALNRPIRVVGSNGQQINGKDEYYIDRNGIKIEFKFINSMWLALK